jgi:hypothetical protein
VKITSLEREVQSKIIRYVIEKGGDAVKVTCPSRRGFPDVLINFKGRMLLVETKREGKDLSGLQEYFFMIWNDKKQNCIMANSLEMFIEKCREIGIKI